MLLGILLGVSVLASVYIILSKGKREKSLPPGTEGSNLVLILIYGFEADKIPGPPTVPILGNLHQIPTKGSYLKYV